GRPVGEPAHVGRGRDARLGFQSLVYGGVHGGTEQHLYRWLGRGIGRGVFIVGGDDDGRRQRHQRRRGDRGQPCWDLGRARRGQQEEIQQAEQGERPPADKGVERLVQRGNAAH